jgi:DNA-binding response OmpR family regulator/DNA-binding CsgD family transcriptional regulator
MNSPPSKPPAQAQPHAILVVDDAVDTLRMLCDALSAEGYVVFAARDAQEALERLEVVIPDGILLDALMPGMDGFELCRVLKAVPHWEHIPIVFMTGLSETEQILKGFTSGGVDYVVKPLRLPEVLARLATHVRNAHATRLAREAVDVAGMGTVVLDSRGRMAWRSPQALRWLQVALEVPEIATPTAGHDRLVARHIGQSGVSEFMLLLHLSSGQTGNSMRQPDVPLTPRETEVLSWLSKGKTNRDIADILGMSHRTVNKHLEHIFVKLGVETRSAATAIAGHLLR